MQIWLQKTGNARKNSLYLWRLFEHPWDVFTSERKHRIVRHFGLFSYFIIILPSLGDFWIFNSKTDIVRYTFTYMSAIPEKLMLHFFHKKFIFSRCFSKIAMKFIKKIHQVSIKILLFLNMYYVFPIFLQ